MSNDTNDVLRDSSMEMSNTNRSNSSLKEGEKLYFTSSLNHNIQTSEVIRNKLKKIKSELRRTKKMVDKRDFKNACEKMKYISRLMGSFEDEHLLDESHSMHTELISEMVIDLYRILAMSTLISPSNIDTFTSYMSAAWDSSYDFINRYKSPELEKSNKQEINRVGIFDYGKFVYRNTDVQTLIDTLGQFSVDSGYVSPMIDMCKYFINMSVHMLRTNINQLQDYLNYSNISSKYTICYSKFREYWESNENTSFFLCVPNKLNEDEDVPLITEVKISSICMDEIRRRMEVTLKPINAFDENGNQLNIDKIRLRDIGTSETQSHDFKFNDGKKLLIMFNHIDRFSTFEMPFILTLSDAIKHFKYLNMYSYKQNERSNLFNILSNYLIFNDINETIPIKTSVLMLSDSNLSVDNLMSNIDNEYVDCINRALSAFMPYGGVKNIKLALNYIKDVIKENNRVNTEKKVESFEDDAVKTEKYIILNPLDITYIDRVANNSAKGGVS